MRDCSEPVMDKGRFGLPDVSVTEGQDVESEEEFRLRFILAAEAAASELAHKLRCAPGHLRPPKP